jgi:hypothetical protein
MKTIKNEKLIKRNGTIGNWASIFGLLLVFIPSYFFLQALLQNSTVIPNFTVLLASTVVGIVVSQIGMYLGIRYGRSPRPDEKLDTGLKGLQNEFVMYHYTTPVSHLLVGPAGVWVVKPYHQPGQVTFEKNRWRIRGGGFMQGYMRIFGQDGLGRPDIEIESEIHSIRKYFLKHMDESQIPEINALVVFTNDLVELDAEAAPVPTMKLKQVKEFLRQKAKEKKLSADTLNQIKTVLE